MVSYLHKTLLPTAGMKGRTFGQPVSGLIRRGGSMVEGLAAAGSEEAQGGGADAARRADRRHDAWPADAKQQRLS